MDNLPDGDVKRALHEIPEEFRLTVFYADVEGYAYKEIAEILVLDKITLSLVISLQLRLRVEESIHNDSTNAKVAIAVNVGLRDHKTWQRPLAPSRTELRQTLARPR